MRSTTFVLAFLVAFTSVEAIFRPGYGHGRRRPSSSYGGYDDQEIETMPPATTKITTVKPSTTKPITTMLESTSLEPTTPELVCPEQFKKFYREQTGNGSYPSVVCLYIQTQSALVESKYDYMGKYALQLCEGNLMSIATTIASEAERVWVVEEMKRIMVEKNLKSASIALDGRRKTACDSKEKINADKEGCSATNAFELTRKMTAPAAPWAFWAPNEPSGNVFDGHIQDCVQLVVDPSNESRNGYLNDMYCDFPEDPEDPQNTAYINIGVLCGRYPVPM